MRDGGPACPGCGSVQALVVAPPTAPEAFGEQGAAWTLIVHALLAYTATGTSPGFLLGTLLFVEALVGILLLVGLEDMPRWGRSLIAIQCMATVTLTVFTGQGTFFGMGLALSVAAYAQLGPDQSRPTVRLGGYAAAALGVAFALTMLAERCGRPPPGWWQDRRVPWLDGEIRIPLPPPAP